jgi:O-antigen/teichoic acid export membrane protein
MIFKSGVILFAGKVLLTLINLAAVLILARLLNPEAFGIIALSQAIIVLCQGALEASFGSFLIQRKKLSRKIEGNTCVITIVVGSLMTLSVFMGAPIIASKMAIPEVASTIRLLSITILFTSIYNTSYNMMLRNMRFKAVIITELISIGFLRIGISIFLAVLGYSYWSVIVSIIAGTAVFMVLLLLLHPVKVFYKFNRQNTISIIQFSTQVGVGNLMAMFALKVDNFFLANFQGPASLGFYSRAYSVVDLTSALLGSIFRTLILSGISDANRKSEVAVQDSQNNFFIAHIGSLITIWPVAITCLTAAPEIVMILLGDQWANAVPLFQILSLGAFLRMGYKTSSSFNIAYGLVKKELYRISLYLLVMTTTTYIAAQISAELVAMAVIFSLLFNYVSLTLVTISHLQIGKMIFTKIIAKQIFVIFLSGILSSIICEYLRQIDASDIYLVIVAMSLQIALVTTYVIVGSWKDEHLQSINIEVKSFFKGLQQKVC